MHLWALAILRRDQWATIDYTDIIDIIQHNISCLICVIMNENLNNEKVQHWTFVSVIVSKTVSSKLNKYLISQTHSLPRKNDLEKFNPIILFVSDKQLINQILTFPFSCSRQNFFYYKFPFEFIPWMQKHSFCKRLYQKKDYFFFVIIICLLFLLHNASLF